MLLDREFAVLCPPLHLSQFERLKRSDLSIQQNQNRIELLMDEKYRLSVHGVIIEHPLPYRVRHSTALQTEPRPLL